MHSQPQRRLVCCKKEKCEADFVYLVDGCGKTYAEVNDPMPHTRYICETSGHNMSVHNGIYQEWVLSAALCKENYHIFDKGVENTFQYVVLIAQQPQR